MKILLVPKIETLNSLHCTLTYAWIDNGDSISRSIRLTSTIVRTDVPFDSNPSRKLLRAKWHFPLELRMIAATETQLGVEWAALPSNSSVLKLVKKWCLVLQNYWFRFICWSVMYSFYPLLWRFWSIFKLDIYYTSVDSLKHVCKV